MFSVLELPGAGGSTTLMSLTLNVSCWHITGMPQIETSKSKMCMFLCELLSDWESECKTRQPDHLLSLIWTEIRILLFESNIFF